MGGAERARDLDRVGEGLGDLQRPLTADQLLERLAFHVLQDDVWRPDVRLAELVARGARGSSPASITVTMCG